MNGGTGATSASAAATALGLGTGDSPQFTGLTLTGDLDVQGGTIQNSTGALAITTGASNGDITLTPDGTGNVNINGTTWNVDGTTGTGTFGNLVVSPGGTFKLGSGTASVASGVGATINETSGQITTTDTFATGTTWTCTLTDSTITAGSRIYVTLGGVTANTALTVSVDAVGAGTATINIYNAGWTDLPGGDTEGVATQWTGLIINFLVVN